MVAVLKGVPERVERSIARMIVRAVLQARSDVSATILSEAVARRDVEAVVRLLGVGRRLEAIASQARLHLRSVLEEAGRLAAEQLGRSVRTPISFDVTNPAAVDYVRERSAQLIREFNDSSAGTVRAVMARSFDEGISPRQAASLLIDSGIGLTERQALAVARFRDRAEEAGNADPEAAAERYAGRLLRHRAELIARTETVAAYTAGQQEMWRQAVDAGQLGVDAEQEWIAVLDDRVDEDCEALDGERVPLGATFQGGVTGPPLHPGCRCSLGIRVNRGRAAA